MMELKKQISITIERTATGVKAWLDGQEITVEKSLKYRRHSPAGFEWGFQGSGPAQFSLAICLELYPPIVACKIYQDFKRKFIASLPEYPGYQEHSFDLGSFNDIVVFDAYAEIGEEKKFIEGEGLKWEEYLKTRQF